MHTNLNQMDLNLLRLFASLWQTGSVTQTATELNLSQPAVSHALKRLRDSLHDPLFIQHQGKMQPTDQAKQLSSAILSALKLLDDALSDRRLFDPKKSNRLFRIASNPSFEMTVIPALVKKGREEGWQVRFDLKPFPENQQDALLSGQLDLISGIADWSGEHPNLKRTLIANVAFGVLGHQSHPLLAADTVSLEGFVNTPQIRTGFFGGGGNYLDEYLNSRGMQRDIAITVNGYSAMPALLRETNWLVAIPQPVAEAIMAPDLIWKPLESPHDTFQSVVYRHPVQDADLGVQWLIQTCQSLFSNP